MYIYTHTHAHAHLSFIYLKTPSPPSPSKQNQLNLAIIRVTKNATSCRSHMFNFDVVSCADFNWDLPKSKGYHYHCRSQVSFLKECKLCSIPCVFYQSLHRSRHLRSTHDAAPVWDWIAKGHLLGFSRRCFQVRLGSLYSRRNGRPDIGHPQWATWWSPFQSRCNG